jgi:hypothetical protein
VVKKKEISNVFVYDAKTYEKIIPIATDLVEGIITISQKFQNVIIDFDYNYYEKTTSCILGRKLV